MKTKYYEPAKIKERVSISQFLKDLGFSPVKKSGGENFYHSMIREADKTPSFCVNERMGLWYSDMFFLNNYQAVLSRHDNSAPVKQVFDLERDHRITALQAYRLLSGYSFEKEILFRAGQENNQEPAEKRAVWLKLNLAVTDAYGNHPLHRFYPEYNFDLEKSVGKYPFYLAGEDRKEKLLKDLKNGGLAELELMVDGKPLGVFVAAEPQFKTLTIYSRDMVRIPDAQIFAPGQNQSQAAQSTGQTTQSGSVSPDQKPWKGDEDIVQAPKLGR